MIYTRTFQRNITLTNVQEIYQTDMNELLVRKLQSDLENKCYKSCYIISINKIINRSDINFNNKDLNASANVIVRFEASILEYNKYDVLTNVKITAITDSKIICQSKNSSIFIQYEDRLKTYKDGQIIPVKIGVCKYYLGENRISINAFPFVPLKEEYNDEIYYNIKKLTENEITELNSMDITKMIIQIEEEMTNIKSEKNNRWNYFDELLYPFKSTKKTNKNIKEIGLLDFDKLNDEINIITLLPQQFISNKKLLLIDMDNKNNKKRFGDENYPVEENTLNIYIILLTRYYKHIKTVNEMSLLYKDDEIFNNHENIFNIYKSNKL